MSLRRPFQYKAQDLAVADLVITPRANRGYRLLEIGGVGLGVGQGLIVTINDNRQIFIPVLTLLSNVAYPNHIDEQTAGLFEQVKRWHPEVPLFIAGKDEEIRIERANTAGACSCNLWYEEYDGDDIPNIRDPGGSLNDTKMIVQSGTLAQDVGAGVTATYQVINSVMPSGFRGFPFTETVPSNRQMSLLGLAVGYDDSSSGNTVCNGIRVWHEDQSILAFEEDFAPIDTFPITLAGADRRLMILPQPVVMFPNDEMKVELNFTNSGGGVESTLTGTSFIFQQVPV